jgi:glycosyltransferase involved in cell wall biosynthesis
MCASVSAKINKITNFVRFFKNRPRRMKKLKIGLFNECFPPIQDGVSQVVENYARLMHQAGHDVTVATAKVPFFDYQHPYKVKNFLSVPIPVRRPYRWGIPTWMAPWQPIYQFKSDILHFHSPFTAARIAMKLAKKNNTPLVATFHSKYRDDFRASVPSDWIVDKMLAHVMQVFDAADEVWVGAPGVIDVLREYGYKGKVEIVPHAIDFDLSGQDVPALKIQAKKQLGVPDGVPCLLFVGQIIHAKNILYTLEALRLLHQQNVPFKMFYVGKGNASEELQQTIQAYGMQDCVHYVGQLQDRNHLQTYYAAADMFLFPSLYDTLGLVVREAAAHQAPSLLLADSTAAKGISHGVEGFIAPQTTPADFAQTLHNCLLQPSLIKEVGKTAAQTLGLTWQQVVPEVIDRYQSLLNRKQR